MTTLEHSLVLIERADLARDVIGLTLAHPERHPLPSWAPGAHIDLCLPDGRIRQYSLCGDVTDPHSYRIAVLRDANGRGGSQALHCDLRVGDLLRVGAPRNHFQLVPAARYLFIAGGIGITPLLPMIAEAEAAGADWQLVYGGRSIESMAFIDQLAPHGKRVRLWPQDRQGLMPLDALIGAPDGDTSIYCCGPESLLQAVKARCEHQAWPADALHVEHFAPPSTASSNQCAAPFELYLSRSGLTFSVPSDRTILDVLDAAGVPVRQSCGVGTCGTCECRVLEGEVDHRDTVLTPAERQASDYMMICVSRASSPRLVLDM
jgi:ferredoxin-NADP reductase